MRGCIKHKRDLLAFLYGELEEKDRELLNTHLDECSGCKCELEELKKVVETADVLNADIQEAAASVDWESLPSQIIEHVFKKESITPRESWWEKATRFLIQPKLRPVYAALFIGIILGAIVTLVVFRVPQPTEVSSAEYIVSQDFLEKVELEMARRETLDYLKKSEFLLLDFVQTSTEKSAEFWQSQFASHKARDLLAKKKYINPQLDKFQMAKAKTICDQIELLFFELSQISVQISAEEVKKLQKMIEEKQLLLKISLIKKELEQSEV